MLGCTKYKCKEVTVFFIYLLLPAYWEGKIQPTFMAYIDRNCSKNEIKQNSIFSIRGC